MRGQRIVSSDLQRNSHNIFKLLQSNIHMRIAALATAVLLLLLLPNISHAFSTSVPSPVFCQPGNNPIPNAVASYTGLGIALIALTFSFDVIAIAFALSRIFPSLGIRNWLQNEYWEVTKSAIIIACVYSVITLVGNISYSLAPSAVTAGVAQPGFANINGVVGGAEGYLCGVNSNLTNEFQELGIISSGTGFWSSVQVGFYIPSFGLGILTFGFLDVFAGVSFLPFANWVIQTGNYFITTYGSIVNDLVNFVLFPFTAFVIGVITLLPALAYLGLTFFIPMGVVFRSFPFVRGVGGTLIAIGICLALVIPSTFILFNYQVTTGLAQNFAIVEQPPFMSNVQIPCPFTYLFQQFSLPEPLSGIPSVLSTVTCIPFGAESSSINSEVNFGQSVFYGAVAFQNNALWVYMDKILRYNFYVIIQMLLFVFDIIIIYPLTDNIARAMGGSIRLSLGGKLRLA